MSFISNLFGGAAVKIPEANIPAAPAPTRREDSGADVTLGTTLANQRLSGGSVGSTTRSTTGSYDFLGGLGHSAALAI